MRRPLCTLSALALVALAACDRGTSTDAAPHAPAARAAARRTASYYAADTAVLTLVAP